MHKLIYSAAAYFLITTMALAATLPPEWSDCKSTKDCRVVASSCGPSVGINKKYKSAAYEKICETENCNGSCDGSAFQADKAICQAGHCVPDRAAMFKKLQQMQH